MILVCGVLADTMTELMCARLADLGYPYRFLDQVQFPGRCAIRWEIDRSGIRGTIATPEGTVDLADLTGVYTRYVSYRGGPPRPDLTPRERDMVEAEYQLALMQLFDLLPCTVVNRAKSSTSNDSKVFQGFVATAHGLRTPRTLVTTEPAEVRRFYAACERRVIYKSLSGIRSIVHRLSDADLGDRLDRVQNCPTQFQEWIDGVDIRVHTVGEEVFATEIVSEAADYRYAGRQGAALAARAAALPPVVATACVGLARSLGLAVAGIDLRRTPDGQYVCFEINPSPGFLFYERATGQPISLAVANLLRGAAS
jgi:glutathione synthase/RimK-type ligase-like ATP-grasp enzyme